MGSSPKYKLAKGKVDQQQWKHKKKGVLLCFGGGHCRSAGLER